MVRYFYKFALIIAGVRFNTVHSLVLEMDAIMIVIAATKMMPKATKSIPANYYLLSSEPTTTPPAKITSTQNQFNFTTAMLLVVVVVVVVNKISMMQPMRPKWLVFSTFFYLSSSITLCTDFIFHHTFIHIQSCIGLKYLLFVIVNLNVPHDSNTYIDIKHQKSIKRQKKAHEQPTLLFRHANNHFARMLCST